MLWHHDLMDMAQGKVNGRSCKAWSFSVFSIVAQRYQLMLARRRVLLKYAFCCLSCVYLRLRRDARLFQSKSLCASEFRP